MPMAQNCQNVIFWRGCWPSRCGGICWKFPFPTWLSSFKLYRLAHGDDLYACQSRNQRPATASTKMSLPGVISLDESGKNIDDGDDRITRELGINLVLRCIT